MAQVATFSTPAETFEVGRALAAGSSLTVELERLVPTGQKMVPFLWVRGDGIDDFEDRLREETGVGEVEPLFETDTGALYRIEWTSELSTIVRGLFELDFTLLSGVGTSEEWRFEVRFPDGRAASEFQTYLREHGISHELERMQTLSEVRPENDYGLTPDQREALLVASEAGYFREPRESTLAEVADRLDISPSAASGRLRRAHATLVENTLERPRRESDE